MKEIKVTRFADKKFDSSLYHHLKIILERKNENGVKKLEGLFMYVSPMPLGYISLCFNPEAAEYDIDQDPYNVLFENKPYNDFTSYPLYDSYVPLAAFEDEISIYVTDDYEKLRKDLQIEKNAYPKISTSDLFPDAESYEDFLNDL